MITYSLFKKMIDSFEGTHECEIYFKGTHITYMIINNYDTTVNFQRCCSGNKVCDGSEVVFYDSLDTLYHSVSIDGICLEKDWERIESIVVDGAFDLAFPDEIPKLKEWYDIDF